MLDADNNLSQIFTTSVSNASLDPSHLRGVPGVLRTDGVTASIKKPIHNVKEAGQSRMPASRSLPERCVFISYGNLCQR